MDDPLLCLRCDREPVLALPSPDGIEFFRCPVCKREYARKPGQGLHDRWTSPLSLALYGTIFDKHPQDRLPSMIFGGASDEEVREKQRLLVREIREELARPRQKVREIHDSIASEEDLREFLRLFADAVEASLVPEDGAVENAGGPGATDSAPANPFPEP